MRKKHTPPVLKDTQLALQRVREHLAPHPEWAEAVEEIDTALHQLKVLISDAELSNGATTSEIVRNCIDLLRVLKDIAEMIVLL